MGVGGCEEAGPFSIPGRDPKSSSFMPSPCITFSSCIFVILSLCSLPGLDIVILAVVDMAIILLVFLRPLTRKNMSFAMPDSNFVYHTSFVVYTYIRISSPTDCSIHLCLYRPETTHSLLYPTTVSIVHPSCFLSIVHSSRLSSVQLRITLFLHPRPHLLQILDDHQIRIHESVDTVLHTRFFASVQFARGDFAGDAFAETSVG